MASFVLINSWNVALVYQVVGPIASGASRRRRAVYVSGRNGNAGGFFRTASLGGVESLLSLLNLRLPVVWDVCISNSRIAL